MLKENIVEIKTQAELSKALPNIYKLKTVVIDTETTGLDPLTDKPILFQIGNDKVQYVIHWYNVDIFAMKSYLEDKSILKIFHNHKFDYKFIKVHSGIVIRDNVFDTNNAEIIVTGGEGKSGLKVVAKKYLNIDLDKEERTTFTKWNKNKTLEPQTILYAARDVIVPYLIYKVQTNLIKKYKLEFTANLEFRLSSDIGDMELNGMYVDKEEWLSLARESRKEADKVKELLDEQFKNVVQIDLFGKPLINYNSPEQLKVALKSLGVSVPNTQDGTLKEHADHPAVKALLENRKWQKRLSTYGETFVEHINPSTGRIHTDFWQILTTGRVSSSNPNLQNIPTPRFKGDLNFRNAFKAQNPNGKMLTVDYSGCELRILAELSKDPTLIEAFNSELETGEEADVHSMIASLMFGVPVSKKQNKELRDKTKSLNFGLIYGMSSSSLASRLGVSNKEGKRLVNLYFKTLPGIAAYLTKSAHEAANIGYTRTIGGRIRMFTKPDINEFLKYMDSYEAQRAYDKAVAHIERQGMNAPIQGTNADITKLAIIKVSEDIRENKRNVKLVSQVHDELVFEGEDLEEYKDIAVELMLSAQEYFLKSVPPRVTATIEKSWSK